MSHPKSGETYSHRFELSDSEEEQARLHEFLVNLGKNDQASQWIRKNLIAAMQRVDHPVNISLGLRKPSKPKDSKLSSDTSEDVVYESVED